MNEEIHTFKVMDIKIAQTTYQLRTILYPQFKSTGTDAQYTVNELNPCFVGRGKDYEEAELNWRFKVHNAFQHLFRKRPFQMTERERVEWTMLSKVIDVEQFEKDWIVNTRELGYVLDNNSHNYSLLIQWIGGEQERIDLIKAEYPAEMITYHQSQYFEAITSRVSSTGKLVKLVYVSRTDPIKPMGEEATKKFWNDMKTTKDLPDV